MLQLEKVKEITMKKFTSVILVFVLIVLNVFCASAKEFDDVKKSDWYSEAVSWAYNKSVMNGISDTSFNPDGKTTRSMLVTVLWRICGEPSPTASAPFTDLTADWYKNAIAWAYEYGIVNGTSETEFSPDENLSREAMATILYRFLNCMKYNFPEPANLNAFTDSSKISTWSKDAMCWAVTDGIITGSNNSLMPQDGATRAQCAVVFMRFCEKYQEILLFKDNPLEDCEYQNIECVDLGLNYRNKYFASNNSDNVLNLRYPSAWKFTLDNGVTFKYNNIEIGKIVEGEIHEDNWKAVSRKSITNGDYETVQYIEKSGSGVTLKFRYRYVYFGLEKPFTTIFDYKSVNERTAKRLLEDTHIENVKTDARLGTLSSLKNAKNIIILGNSFVGTSKIGAILGEMYTVNNISTPVYWISRGYATVATYVSDYDLMQKIKDGYYGAVFICGLYTDAEIENLKILEKACNKSNTELVILPAHNENQGTIDKARQEFPHLTIIDWKNEVQAFIDNGMSKWDFCKNDAHFHSTPLAGYVGAHMIYRAIQSEMPSADMSQTISQEDVENKLGTYIKKGCTRRIDTKDINYFN